jgi:pimeloyl-ACP methyl ester carboxylesterase
LAERPALVLLPGLLCDQAAWAGQIAGLADIADVTVGDLYGFDSISAMATSVLSKAPERFALAGHSMGARVALEMIRQAPERITHLALLDTGIHPRQPGEVEKRGALVEVARREGMAAMAAKWLPPMVHPSGVAPAIMQDMMDMVCRATPDIFAGQQQALLDRPDAAAGLGAIDCPVLVGVGRQDVWSPLSQHETIVSHIDGAVLVVFEESGHMAPMERPDAVTAAMRSWLGR